MQGQTNVFTYPRGEPGTLGHLDLVEPLRVMPGELESALKGVTTAGLQARAAEDGWTLGQTIAHLRDSVRINHQRLYMMSTQTDPLLPAFDLEANRTKQAIGEGEVASMLGEIKSWRSDTVDLLTSLVNWNWARSGQHETFGRMSIRQLVEHMIEDEATHLREIRELRAQEGGR